MNEKDMKAQFPDLVGYQGSYSLERCIQAIFDRLKAIEEKVDKLLPCQHEWTEMVWKGEGIPDQAFDMCKKCGVKRA